MVPSIYGENMFDDFFGSSFFGGRDSLFGKHARNLMKTDIHERYAGACSRSFYIGDVKPEDVKAKYESGVLTVIVPKEDAKKLASGSAIAIE